MTSNYQGGTMNQRQTLRNEDIAEQASEAYGRDFNPASIFVAGPGKPGQGLGQQVFHGTDYIGRLHRGQLILDRGALR
jgi:hypothetical protein